MQEAIADGALSGCRILIVEDDFIMARTVAEIVRRAGASIAGPFRTVVHALEHLSEMTAIDGAILDIGLGDEQSYPLAEALQTTGIPFIFLTGMQKSELPQGFGRARHILKPFADGEIVDSLLKAHITRQ